VRPYSPAHLALTIISDLHVRMTELDAAFSAVSIKEQIEQEARDKMPPPVNAREVLGRLSALSGTVSGGLSALSGAGVSAGIPLY
jgi:hypothetical protein